MIAERFHFHKRNQALGESIADYDAALRRFATHCKFDNYLEDALRDRFVCGLRNEAIQKRLLAETDLTLSKAMELAQGMEAADRNTRLFKGMELAVNRLGGWQSQGQGNSKHAPDVGKLTMRRRNADSRTLNVMHACGKKGHIAPACRSKSRTKSNPPVNKYRKKPPDTNLV